jgi:hypothetical protein
MVAYHWSKCARSEERIRLFLRNLQCFRVVFQVPKEEILSFAQIQEAYFVHLCTLL